MSLSSIPASPPASKPVTHRRVLTVAGLIATAAGMLAAAVGAFIARDWLWQLGLVTVATGILWLACARLPRSDEPMRAVHRRYLREFFPAMAAYVVVLPVSIMLLQKVDMPTALRALVVLLPMLPVMLVVRAIAHFVSGLDELQQRIQLQAITITCAIVATATFALGFLQGADVVPTVTGEMIWVLPVMFVVYAAVAGIISRRYRA